MRRFGLSRLAFFAAPLLSAILCFALLPGPVPAADSPAPLPALRVALHRSADFSPRDIGAGLLAGPRESLRGNDSPVLSSAVSRATRNVLRPLPQESRGAVITLLGSTAAAEAGEALMAHFANFVLSAAHDAAPLIADYGCRIANAFARRHPRSTVLCIADDPIAKRPQGGAGKNVLRLVARGGIVPLADEREGINNNKSKANHRGHCATNGFAPFFTACTFVSVATLFTAAVPLRRGDTERDRARLLETAAAALRNSGALLVALPPDTAMDCASLLAQLRTREGSACAVELQNNFSAAKDLRNGMHSSHALQCEAVASVSEPRTGARVLTLFRVQVTYAQCVCRKTWGAPLLQWGRAVLREYNATRVTFRVIDTTPAAHTRATAARRIAPLQYVPSVSLDALLGAGLSMYERLRVFGDMLISPRYPDPLPHNWMIGNSDILGTGGRAFRIDTYDRRFSNAVREERNYWATATRGYVRLLAYHLCLPLRDGLPEVMFALRDTCRALCRSCVAECVYGPHGMAPCEACLQCGTCVRRHAEEKETISGHPLEALREAEPCVRYYRNYAEARTVWEAWRREDLRHPINL